MVFDVKKHKVPEVSEVNMKETRRNVGTFFETYRSAQDRVNQPLLPKITTAISDMPRGGSGENNAEAEKLMIINDEAKKEYNYLNHLFVKGISSVQHPFKPDLTERRKKIFKDRFLNGMAFYEIGLRNAVCEETARKEANYSLIQFAKALNLITFR